MRNAARSATGNRLRIVHRAPKRSER